MTKILFQVNVERSAKNLWKIIYISADVKANVKK